MVGLSRSASSFTLLVFVAMILAAGAYDFLFAEQIVHAEPVRLVMGSLLIFLLPGLVFGELIGLRGRSPLETIALAAMASLTVEVGLVAVVFVLAVSIQVWVALLLAITALGTAAVAVTVMRGRRLTFISGLVRLPPGTPVERMLHLGCVAVPLVLGALAYGWGEQPGDVSGEKYIHMMFVRYYAEMPLVLSDLGLYPGLPPPNLVHLWEFLLAGWACCARVDPLPVFCHARMVVPVLGLAGMYLLIRLVFLDWRKSTVVFAGVLLLAVGQVVLETSNLRWVNATDPTRGVFAFFGTAHHADSAMDILLPVTAAVLLLFLRQPRWTHGLVLVGVLAANFLWHPREFLQAALYLGMLLPAALLLPSLRRRLVLGRWLATAGILIGVALGSAVLSRVCVTPESQFYDESALKRMALAYALEPGEITTVRSLFQVPLHYYLANPNEPDVISREKLDAIASAEWNLDRWWLLAAAATIVLIVLGGSRDRQLAFYHLVFWLLAYCWNFSMLVILALTYSEFYLGTPRLLYLFSYLVIADATLVLASVLYRAMGEPSGVSRRVMTGAAVALLALGNAGLLWWMRRGHPGASTVAAVLNVGCLSMLVAVFWCERPRWNAWPVLCRLRRPLPMAIALLLVAAAICPTNATMWRGLVGMARPSAGDPDWFGDNNPMGYSRELIAWSRSLPPRQRIATSPLDIAMINVYAPQYLCVQPVGSVIADQPEREWAAQGRHPFYRPALSAPAPFSVDHAEALTWLRERQADYVLLNRHDYDRIVYFQQHPEKYELVFENSVAAEAVFRIR